jgi:hypothetical protein
MARCSRRRIDGGVLVAGRAALDHEQEDAQRGDRRQDGGGQQRDLEGQAPGVRMAEGLGQARQQSAQGGADHEAHAERRAQQAHAARALFGRGDVGHVALDRRDVAAAEAAGQADGEGPGDVGREGQGHVGQRVGQDGDDQHRPPADAVGQATPERLGDELPQRIGREHRRHLPGAGVQRLGVERQQRDDQPEAHQVDEHHQQQHVQRARTRVRRLGVRRLCTAAGADGVAQRGHQAGRFTPDRRPSGDRYLKFQMPVILKKRLSLVSSVGCSSQGS